ncbi:MAG: PAS domain-containing protein [Chitinophagaceae bacterium]
MDEQTRQEHLARLKALFGGNGEMMDEKIADFFPAIVYVYDTSAKKLRYINRQVTDVLGYTYEDIDSWDDNFMRLVFEDDKELVKLQFEKFHELEGDISDSYNCRLVKKQGDWRYFRTIGSVLKRNENGKPASVLFIAQDITDQLQTEQEAKAVKELFADTEEMLRFGTWTWLIPENILQWSEGMYKLLGYEKKELVGKLTNEFYLQHVKESQRRSLQEAMETALANKSDFYFQHSIYRKNDGEIIVSSRGKVVCDDAGKQIKMVGVTHDISDQVHSHEELIDYRHRNIEREIFLGSGSWEEDLLTGKIAWSEGMYRLYGYSPEQQIGKLHITSRFIEEHQKPEDVERGKLLLQQVNQSGENSYLWDYDVTITDGTIRRLESYAKLIRNAEGKPVKIIGNTRDITQLRMAQRNLEAKVSELNRSNKELEEFAYVASHDLQEPLRKLSTLTERLGSRFTKELGDDGRAYTSRIIAAADNMRLLIDNLLEFSRVTRSTVFEPVDLNTVLARAKQDLDLMIEETKATIVHEILPVVEGVPSQYLQVFDNLLGNSLKFRKTDLPPVITISSVELDQHALMEYGLPVNQKWYKIQVEDNGIGFEPEYVERIFQIFQRLHGKVEYPGSGMGLAICKKVIENYGGIIFATSEVNKGTIFTLILPEKIS